MLIDVIIPTYKPDDTFKKLVEMLEKQTIAINRIIVMNTEEKYELLENEEEEVKKYGIQKDLCDYFKIK